ncbi:MAG: enoyl-CoA hydratase/isomerase family protein [Deltaproteobacteria bacterium]|nr:enoyl-CoA hydratase/isomerase family protein [Deltaproteobacteria bacterium]
MSYETIKYDVSEGIGTITINRPDVLNALNLTVLSELLDAIGEASADEQVRVLILTGAGRSFVAGADIAQMKDFSTRQGLAFGDQGHAVMAALETMDKPAIAAVNGFALGGGTELSLGCDFIYASSKAKFGQPEVNLGIIPGFGGTQRLARTVGMNKARELIYSGEVIDAQEAKRIGLVSEVFEPDDFIERVREKAKLIMSKGPVAISTAKRVMNKGVDLTLDSALELEKQAFSALFGSEDQSEGMAAFLEKRKAEFKGR